MKILKIAHRRFRLFLLFAILLLAGCSDNTSSVPNTNIPDASAVRDQTRSTANAADVSAGTAASSATPESDGLQVSEDAFRMAAYEGELELVASGIKAGVDVNATDQQQRLTALHMAAYNGHTQVVDLLLQNGAKVDPRDHQGKTPLIHACTGPFQATVKRLLESGADINAKEAIEGFTPLMMAAGLGELEVVKVLLRNNADQSIRDTDSDRAIDHARNSGHIAIINILTP